MRKKNPDKGQQTKSYPIHSDSVMYRIDESEISTLIDLNTGKYFSLNAVGTLIWRLADGSRTATEIKAEILERFTITDKNAASIGSFIASLQKQGFLLNRSAKVKGVSPLDFENLGQNKTRFEAPKITHIEPEALNVFGMPGPGAY